MTQEEKDMILSSYKWIKVKRYVDDESISWEERYQRLDKHHVEETNFLIDKLSEIVKEIDLK